MTAPDRADNGSKPSSFSALPNYPTNPFRLSEIDPVACGECEEIRPDIKPYDVLHMVFLPYFSYCRCDTHFKCPGCMRRFLCRRILPALLFANVFSPVILIWWGLLFLRTFLR